MSFNNETYNLSTSLSNETEKLTRITSDNCSLFSNYEFIKLSNSYPSINWNSNINSHDITSTKSNLYTNELNSLTESNRFHSIKCINYDKETLPTMNTGNPLDYSINSLINKKEKSVSPINKSSFLTDSNSNHNLIQYSNETNNIYNTSPSTCSIEYTSNSIKNEIKSPKMNEKLTLKRRYSKNLSNSSAKHSKKYMRVDYNNDTDQNSFMIDHSNQNNSTSHFSTTKQLYADNLVKDTSALNRTIVSTIEWKTHNNNNNNTDFKGYDKNSMDTIKLSKTVQSNDQNILFNDNHNEINVSNDNDNNDTKMNTISTGAYKYLTWREKDRRRRFREEWKHLWLVIPYGRYEVMCLVCHKIMTQRKLDTIKRHNVRRHGELQGMSHIERQILFDKLLKQHNIHNETMTNTSDILSNKLSSKSKPKYKSTTDSNTINSGNDSNEIVNDLIHHTNSWLTHPTSEINQVPNPIIKSYSSSINLPFSDHIPYKRNKRLFNKKDKMLYTTTELAENTTNKKNKRLPKKLQKNNSHCSSPNSTENLNDHYNLSVSTNPLERLSFIGWKNYTDSLDISNLGDQLKTKSDKKTFVSNVTSSISTISHLSTNCSLPSLSNASSVLPSNYDIEKLKQFIKPFIALNYNLFSQSLLSSSSSPPTKLPTSCYTMDSSNKFMMPRLGNEFNCTPVNDDILHNNFVDSINQGNQNIRFDIAEHIGVNEYNKIMSDESSERIVNEKLNDKNYLLNNNNKNNNTSKEISPVNQSNLLNVNESLKRLRSSSSSHSSNDPNPTIAELSSFMIASWIESIENSSKIINSNLPEPTWNIQSINDSNQLIITKPIEKFISSKCSIDQFQYDHNHEINQQIIHSTDFKLNTKSNSNLNKFTISSLLNTEIMDKTKIGSEIIENDHYIDSLQKCNQKQETTKMISNPQCLS
ncbi:unnamed protein product [Schistosoma margrebowiei]|uniref:SPIN-DOC-like zinc-finger domain-containing protein n=1 Tax=Schistosoma margrebowiei TaxID=48269 RepID=A0AA84ZYI1_9TREM|nr:unnamed protein product [Schistosoma margrebowiei]